MGKVMSKIVKASDLHIECFSPLLYLKRCFECARYRYCKYPCKVVNSEYERLQAERRKLMRKVKEIDAKVKAL